ncbi:MAG: DMT family transporter, partial [Pseudomonadota bacterium]|nr:DMT family transporter [Pseudomonadota bacterium]
RPQAENSRSALSDWVGLLLLSSLWGSSYIFYKVLVGTLPPITLVCGRLAIAAIMLNIVLSMGRDRASLLDQRLWPRLLVLGALNNALPFCLIAWSEVKLPAGLAAILGATVPVFAILVSVVGGIERMTASRCVAVCVGLVGVAFACRVWDTGGQPIDPLSALACLAAALSYAIAGYYSRRFANLPPLAVATGQITASALLTLPFSLLIDQPWRLAMPAFSVWGALLGIGLGSTALAYCIFFNLIRKIGVANTVMVAMLVPVTSVLIGHLLLHEPVDANLITGMILIGCAMLLADGRLVAAARRRGMPPSA